MDVLQGHFQIVLDTDRCPLFLDGLSVFQKVMYCSGVWAYVVGALSTPFFVVVPLVTIWAGIFPIIVSWWAACEPPCPPSRPTVPGHLGCRAAVGLGHACRAMQPVHRRSWHAARAGPACGLLTAHQDGAEWWLEVLDGIALPRRVFRLSLCPSETARSAPTSAGSVSAAS